MDLGSGDARGPYRWALRERDRLFIASDANAAGLLETAWRAARKPSRCGIPNLICVAEPLERLAAELASLADRVSILLPWGSLLRAVAAPDLSSLEQIRRLCLPGAEVEIVFSCDPRYDRAESARLSLPDLNQAHIASHVRGIYREAGLEITAADCIASAELAGYGTTWAKRLSSGRAREIWRIAARAAG